MAPYGPKCRFFELFRNDPCGIPGPQWALRGLILTHLTVCDAPGLDLEILKIEFWPTLGPIEGTISNCLYRGECFAPPVADAHAEAEALEVIQNNKKPSAMNSGISKHLFLRILSSCGYNLKKLELIEFLMQACNTKESASHLSRCAYIGVESRKRG